MCSYVGIVNFDRNLLFCDSVIKNMTDKIYFKNSNRNNYFQHEKILLGQYSKTKPYTLSINGNTYVIVFSGKIYNKKDLIKTLLKNDISITTTSDVEILLKAYTFFEYDILNYLDGSFSFAIWDSKKEELFIARDHLGVKPFFYTFKNNNFIFSTEIKTILSHPEIDTVLNKTGICELIGLGPAHTSGLTLYKDIYELKPGYFGIFDKYGLKLNQYWKLQSKPHTDDFSTTCIKVKELLETRRLARENKDFKTSDEIRDKLKDLGFLVIDSKEGQKLKKV